MQTKLTLQEDKFFLNGTLVYDEIPHCPHKGLLMNMRMIQGVYDDKCEPERYHRYGKVFDPAVNTQELIDALPAWYEKGIRAITVGFQGGGPCFTIDNQTIENNPFSADGTSIDPAYLDRMEKIILAADALGMVVIVSYFYGAQTRFIPDDYAVMNCVKTASNWLRDKGFTNIIIEIANEHDVRQFMVHPILYTPVGMVRLIEIAKRESNGMPVGCSGTGGYYDESIAQASDIIILHGNSLSRQRFYDILQKAKAVRPIRPILINEDSQAMSNLEVAVREEISWGYYNNMTKQEPPVYWGITKGEDEFFALRVCKVLGIPFTEPQGEERFYLQGLEPHMTYENKRWIRLASYFAEEIDYVEFFRNGTFVGRAYDDPFMIPADNSNWRQKAYPDVIVAGEVWEARIILTTGQEYRVQTTVQA